MAITNGYLDQIFLATRWNLLGIHFMVCSRTNPLGKICPLTTFVEHFELYNFGLGFIFSYSQNYGLATTTSHYI